MSVSELRELKEEEKVLTEIASKFNDQLNRLKVEELALINQLRSKREDEALSETTDDFLMDDEAKSLNTDVDLLEELDLAVNSGGNQGEVEEDEEKEDETATEGSEEEEYQDDLKALMQQINAHRSHYD